MKENRIKKIFEILTDDFDTYTATEISNLINFSSKTVREDIKELNMLLTANGAIIESKPGVGYYLTIKNKEAFSLFIKEVWPKYALDDGLNSQEYRVNKIILDLITESSYIKSDTYLDLLFISKSQLNQDLKVVREILSENHIEITSKPHYGMKIKGNEIDIRHFLVSHVEDMSKINANILQDISSIETSKINDISTFVLNQFKHYGFDTNLVKYNNFINYLIISISRIQNGYFISKENKDEPIYEKYSSIYKLSLSIANDVEEKFNINLDDKEVEYLYINLLSKIDSYTPSEYNENIEQIIERTLMAIKNTLSIDLSNDLDLKYSLMIHLNPMIKRIKYGINLKNPLLEDIRRDHVAMECAKLCSSYLEEIYRININNDELGYIALHFSASMAKLRENLNKKNILLICASGRATARVLKYRFMHEFSKYINNLDTSDYLMAISMDLSAYDLIVTTIPVTIDTEVPVIEASAYLYKKDVKKILDVLRGDDSIEEVKALFDKKLFIRSSEKIILERDNVLNKMIDDIVESKDINKKIYYEEVIKRENLTSTSLDNCVAIPHPLTQVNSDNFISVYLSTDSINWSGKKVNIVLLLNISDNIDKNISDNFFRFFSDFLNDNNKIYNAIKSNNLDEFMNIFFSN